MIVYPQVSSLRLIIVPLIIALLTLGYYSYQSHTSIKEYERFIEQENNSVASELNDMILNYNELSVYNDSIMQELDNSKFKISRILDSIYTIKPDLKLVAGYKKQLQVLKQERLKQEALLAEVKLEKSLNKTAKYSSRNSTLSNINTDLEKQLKEASKLKVANISVKAIKRQTDKRTITTTSARRAKRLDLCFTIPENKFATKGDQEFYIQIIDPENNVVGDKGEVIINGSKLIKSKTININYFKEELKVCHIIEPNKNEPFVKGIYHVSLYNKNGFVNNTTITLK